MANKNRKFLFNKKRHIVDKTDDLLAKEHFYQMLLKFQKKHLLFDVEAVMQKLYSKEK